MNIFGGRPGIAAGVLAVIAILAAAFCICEVNIGLLITAGVFVILCVILCSCRYISAYRLFVNILVTAVFCTSLLRGLDVFYNRALKAYELCGEKKYLHATVTERKSSGNYYTNYVIRVHSVNGIECNEKATLTCEYNSELQKGYEFVLRNAEIQYALNLEKSEAISLISEEIFLSVTTSEQSDYAILSENNISWEDEFKDLNSFLSAKLRNAIKGDEGRLATAMLLGDKSDLTDEMYRDFSRAGLSHYLAVSGLHVSIITGMVSFSLMKLRVRRSVRNLLIMLFAIFYLYLLGFPISAVRAVLMLLAVFMAYSMGDLSDSTNALGIAASIIVIVSPMAVFDKGFILSFCATLGIVSFMPLFNDIVNKLFCTKKKDGEERKIIGILLKKVVAFVFGTLMSVAAALSLTLLPITYLFGETSVLGFSSNLAAALAATPLLASALLYLIFGGIPYIGEGLEFVIRLTSRYMLDLASELSDTRGALLSLTSQGAHVIVWIFSIVIFVFLIIKIKRKKLILAFPVAYPLVIFVITLVTVSIRPIDTEITFISTGKHDVIIAECGGESAIIDVSDGSLTCLRLASMRAHEEGITEFDILVLTHYHSKHLSSVSQFIAGEKVRRALLPFPKNESDAWIMAQLVDVFQSSGVACEIMHPESETLLLGDTYITVSKITRLERSNHPVIYFSLSDNDERLTYLSESSWEADKTFASQMEIYIKESEILVFGSHGPIAKNSVDLLIDEAKMKNIVVFDKSHLRYIAGPESTLTDVIENSEVYTGAGVYKYAFGESVN